MGLMNGAVLGTGNLATLVAEVQPYLPDGHPPVHGQTSTGIALAIAAGLIVLSIVGGYYVTRGVLHLAARTGAAESASGAGGGAASDPASPATSTAGPPTGTSAPGAADPTGSGQQAGAAPGPADPGPTGPTAVAALRGGTWIGILERLAVTGLILVGYPGGIAILVAIKGLGRYPELKDNPGASERFVVGTLASIVWAAGLGVLGLWWIG
ncbi:hypothetical protein SANBI_001737 [Sanguibacter sp. 4.1]|uniref:Uncharacterized protein n=1 Tax=Sanguibacter biliveldensis TaxID=3030830 RepID=A0AAF1C467_9MICO|nr:hypothetical protein [Sanguibacter sp. 4.1]WPF84020.1 hypothetical protein SANBI_001737 [Sanguibacter sp. 4.1]